LIGEGHGGVLGVDRGPEAERLRREDQQEVAEVLSMGPHGQGHGGAWRVTVDVARHADRVVGEDREGRGWRLGNVPAHLEVEQLGKLLSALLDEASGPLTAGGELGSTVDCSILNDP
jgi:hypothetical protein